MGASTTGSDTTRLRGLHLPPARVEEIKRLSQDPMIYEKLAQVNSTHPPTPQQPTAPHSNRLDLLHLLNHPPIYLPLQAVAPSIWELDDVKKGVLCLLFGGTDKKPGARKER